MAIPCHHTPAPHEQGDELSLQNLALAVGVVLGINCLLLRAVMGWAGLSCADLCRALCCRRRVKEHARAELLAAIHDKFPVVRVAPEALEAAADDCDLPACAVCLAPMREGEECRELQCGHAFHAECVATWFVCKGLQKGQPSGSLDCPLCRRRQRGFTMMLERIAGPKTNAGLEADVVGGAPGQVV